MEKIRTESQEPEEEVEVHEDVRRITARAGAPERRLSCGFISACEGEEGSMSLTVQEERVVGEPLEGGRVRVRSRRAAAEAAVR